MAFYELFASNKINKNVIIVFLFDGLRLLVFVMMPHLHH